MTNFHAVRARNRMNLRDTIAQGERVDVHGTEVSHGSSAYQTHRSLLCVAMNSLRGSQSTPCTMCECSRSANTHSPGWVSAAREHDATLLTGRGLPDRCGVICGAGNDELSIGRPCNIEDMLVRHPTVLASLRYDGPTAASSAAASAPCPAFPLPLHRTSQSAYPTEPKG